METVACNLCGSTRYTPVYQVPDRRYFPDELFTVVECNYCGLGFVNPRPSFEEMQKYYPPQYYEEEFVQNTEHHLKRYAIEARYLREIERRNGARSLLDVGCANGDFPRFMMRRGWTVEGVEVSASSQPIRDFRVYSQAFPEIPVAEPVYDAVTAWAVLEHVHDPMAYIRKASQVLKRGALFVFLVTNFRSQGSRALFCEDVPRHLYFFTKRTVSRYLETTGFALRRADFRGNIFGMRPTNWLRFFVETRLKKHGFSYRDLPLTRPEFIQRNGLKPGVLSSLKFAVQNPVTVLDRALLPIVEAAEILRRNYGITTYVARKR